MKEKTKLIILIISLIILFFTFNYFSIINLDVIWNYGFSLNFSKGLTMYSDYNMVTTPLYPIVIGTFMKIFGNSMIVFYLINAILATTIVLLVRKLNKKIIIPFILVILLTSEPNYDLLSTIFLFLLILLEKDKKSDYLIGLILGISFLTKSSIGVALSLPTLCYIKNFRIILKRIVGFIIPNIIIIILFLIKGNLYDYLNYAFFGLFDFASGNSSFNILSIITLLIVAYFIFQYRKSKNIENLYIASWQIVMFPLFNVSHFIESLIPVFYHFLSKFNQYTKYYKYSIALFLIPFIFLIYNVKDSECNYTDKPFNIRYIQKEYIDDINSLKNFFEDDFNNVYFIMHESYLYNIMLNRDIDLYSLSLKGNLGYNGEDKFILKINELEKGSIIVTSSIYQGGQSSEKIYNYITKNYSLRGQFRKFSVYIVD